MKILLRNPSRRNARRTWRLAVCGITGGLLCGAAGGTIVIYCVSAPVGSYRSTLVWPLLGALILLPTLLGRWLTIPDPVRRTGAGSVVLGVDIGVSLAQNAPFARPELRIHLLPLIAVAAIGAVLLAYGIVVLIKSASSNTVTAPNPRD